MYIINEDDFDDFCRQVFQELQVRWELSGVHSIENFEDFVERYYPILYKEYIKRMDRTIH
jgi:hypothetical protein